MTALYSYIDVSHAYEITIIDQAPDGLKVQLRDMIDGGSMCSVHLPKEEIPELAYALLRVANEIVSSPQRLLR